MEFIKRQTSEWLVHTPKMHVPCQVIRYAKNHKAVGKLLRLFSQLRAKILVCMRALLRHPGRHGCIEPQLLTLDITTCLVICIRMSKNVVIKLRQSGPEFCLHIQMVLKYLGAHFQCFHGLLLPLERRVKHVIVLFLAQLQQLERIRKALAMHKHLRDIARR